MPSVSRGRTECDLVTDPTVRRGSVGSVVGAGWGRGRPDNTVRRASSGRPRSEGSTCWCSSWDPVGCGGSFRQRAAARVAARGRSAVSCGRLGAAACTRVALQRGCGEGVACSCGCCAFRISAAVLARQGARALVDTFDRHGHFVGDAADIGLRTADHGHAPSAPSGADEQVRMVHRDQACRALPARSVSPPRW